MTSELTCPNCGESARFDERYGPQDEIWLVCTLCGKPTDEKELAAAQEPENGDNSMSATCRFCHEWSEKKSQMLKYGVRHYAHLGCLAKKGRAELEIRRMPKWQLGTLRYFELKDLGLLDLVKSLSKEAQ